MTKIFKLQTSQRLNEIISDLERSHLSESALQKQVNMLSEGLHALSDFTNQRNLFLRLIDILRIGIDFEHAIILIKNNQSPNDFITLVSTHHELQSLDFKSNDLFERVLSDGPANCYNVANIKEWKNQLQSLSNAKVSSALHFSFKSKNTQAIMICTHQKIGHFKQTDFGLASKFSLLAAQALSHFEYTSGLEQMNVYLQNEIEQKNTAQNLAEKRQLQMVQNAKLASLGEIAGNLAHEINNPLSIIKHYFHQLLSATEPLSPTRDDIKQKIDQSIGRITKVLDGLKKFSQDNSAEEIQIIKVRDIVDNIMALTSQRLIMDKVELSIEITPPNLTIECRPSILEQALFNLVTNAEDALEKVNLKKIHITAGTTARSVFISVSDSGLGITSSLKDDIFKPFFTTKTAGKGPGLGLSISKKMIESNNGKISFEIKKQMTTFTISFPKSIVV